MNQKALNKLLLEAVEEIQSQLTSKLAETGFNPDPASPICQAGLKDGKRIVQEFVSHGEAGIALEHIVYMVEETELAISETAREQICNAASSMGMKEIEARFGSNV